MAHLWGKAVDTTYFFSNNQKDTLALNGNGEDRSVLKAQPESMYRLSAFRLRSARRLAQSENAMIGKRPKGFSDV
jgi:hypothetical protein